MQGYFGCPTFGKGCRIVNRELVEDGVGRGPREPFNEMKILVRSSEARPVSEVCGIHDERVAFPMSDRVSQPKAYVWGEMRAAIHSNDSGVVNHLQRQYNHARRLHDLNVVVVGSRQRRWSGG